MKVLDGRTIEQVSPKEIIEELEFSGRYICACGHEYSYDLHNDVNVAEWFGFIVPVCPSCSVVPISKTRRMDI